MNTIKYAQPEQLGLANLNLNDELIAYLASGLRSNTSIKYLYLPFNKITDKGAAEIANLLLESAIKKIYLFNNKIGDEGMTLIASSLLINPNINTAELFNNTFTQKAVHGLKLAAQMNPHIKRLLLYPGDGGIVLEEQPVTAEKRRAFFINYQRKVKHKKMLGTISKMTVDNLKRPAR